MNIPEKIKKENYPKWKNTSSIIPDMQDWLTKNTNVDVTELTKPELVYLIRNNITENPKCPSCNTPIIYKYQKYRKYCSSKCSARSKTTTELRKKTVNVKYGCDNVFQSENVKNKCKQTNMLKYGTTNPYGFGTDNFKNAMMDIYGVAYPSQSIDIKQTIKESSRKRFGTDHPMQNDAYKRTITRKRINTTYDRLLTLNPTVAPNFTKDEFNGGGYDKVYEWVCTKCNSVFVHWFNNGYVANCPHCTPKSKFELGVSDYITQLGIKHIRNTRTVINKSELDIYIQQKALAIECNGNYWHSDVHGGKPKQYHIDKTLKCNDLGVRLIHIFEDEWRDKRDIVKSRLKSILNLNRYKIYGRCCTIRIIDNKTKSKFLTKYHIQGDDRSSIRLGCFYKNRLVAVMSFGKRRFDKKDGYELIRYATIKNFTCIGCAGKLLKHFERNWNPPAIISYADLRWSEGGVYKQLGFTHLHNSKPNYFYMRNHKIRESRIQYQKHKLKDKLDIFDLDIFVCDNLKANKFDRIWDCGNMVFEKVFNK